MMAVGGMAAIMFICLLALVFCCCRRGSKRKSSKSLASSSLQGLEMNSLLRKPGQPKAPEIPLANVQFFTELGEGAFGKRHINSVLFKQN